MDLHGSIDLECSPRSHRRQPREVTQHLVPSLHTRRRARVPEAPPYTPLSTPPTHEESTHENTRERWINWKTEREREWEGGRVQFRGNKVYSTEKRHHNLPQRYHRSHHYPYCPPPPLTAHHPPPHQSTSLQ